MLADMGAVMHPEPTFPPPSNYPRPYARFRAVGAVVRAVFRFRYVCRRKREYLQSKSEKLGPASPKLSLLGAVVEGKPHASGGHPSRVVTFSPAPPPVLHVAGTTCTVSVNHSDRSSSAGLGIGTSARIPMAVSNEGVLSQSRSRAKTAPASSLSSTALNAAKTRGGFASSKRPAQKPHQQTAHSHSTQPGSRSGSNIPKWSPLALHSLPGKGKLKASSAKSGGRGGVLPHRHDYDPQLLEYMEGLERYQSRLSNGKPSNGKPSNGKPSLHTAT